MVGVMVLLKTLVYVVGVIVVVVNDSNVSYGIDRIFHNWEGNILDYILSIIQIIIIYAEQICLQNCIILISVRAHDPLTVLNVILPI